MPRVHGRVGVAALIPVGGPGDLGPDRSGFGGSVLSARLWFGEAEGFVAGHAPLQGAGENGQSRVVVVVYFGSVLAGGGAHDSSSALDEQAVEGDWRGEEQGIQRGGVEAFADERCGADDEDAVAGLGVGDAVDGASPVGAGHAAPQHQGGVSVLGQQRCQGVDVGDPSGEYEAVASAGQGRGDVADDLYVSGLVGDERTVDLRERARCGQIEVVEAEAGLVDVQQASRPCLRYPGVHERARLALGQGVADRSELPGDEFTESVAAGGCRGEPEPELGADAFDRVVIDGCREMVTFVDDDVPVALGELGDVVASGQGWQHRDVRRQ